MISNVIDLENDEIYEEPEVKVDIYPNQIKRENINEE